MLFKRISTLLNGKKTLINIWDVLLLQKRTFTEDISIDLDKSAILFSPVFSGELYLDGEAYIL